MNDWCRGDTLLTGGHRAWSRFPLTLGLEDTWCWPLSCILGVTCDEEIEGPYHQDHVMCVTKLGGSSETVAAKVLDRKCVKNEHEHSSQVCIRAQPRFDYGSTKPVAGNLSLPSPVHDNVSSRYETGQSSCMVQTWQNTSWEEVWYLQ